MKWLIPVIAAALICACTPPKRNASVNLSGYPPSFRAGYLDGCESGKRTKRPVKDPDRFKSDSQYSSGWRDGFDICSKQKQ